MKFYTWIVGIGVALVLFRVIIFIATVFKLLLPLIFLFTFLGALLMVLALCRTSAYASRIAEQQERDRQKPPGDLL